MFHPAPVRHEHFAAMSNRPSTEDRLFRICFLTVEFFSLIMVAVFWVLQFTSSVWGDRFHFHYLFDVSEPVIIIVAITGLLTWQQYRKHALIQFAVAVAWVIWVALPRL